MVEYFISKGAKDLKRGFTGSCASRNKELILFFLKKAEKFIPTEYGFQGFYSN